MAEERTLGLERASGRRDDDDEPSKEELQRRMEEARESISQTVTEIKEAVTNQYNSMKETVTDALDWRHHFRKNPVAFSVGALSVGFFVGYAVAGRLRGGASGSEGYPSYEETDVYARTGARPTRYEDAADARQSAFHGHSYAAQAITDGPGEAADYDYAEAPSYREADGVPSGPGPQQSAASAAGAAAPVAQEQPEEQKPSLYERFKGTSAYDRLQAEVSTLGERFIEELSSTANNVVLPALFNKIKELFGVDLSSQQGRQQTSGAGGGGAAQSGQARQGSSPASSPAGGEPQSAQAASASASLASASRGGSGYATSENRPYGAGSAEQEGRRPGGDSILDLDR